MESIGIEVFELVIFLVVFVLIVVAVFGVVFFIAGIVLNISNRINKKRGKEVSEQINRDGKKCTFFGAVLLLIPVVIFIITIAGFVIKERSGFNGIKNKAYLCGDSYEEGFKYKGKQMVVVDFLTSNYPTDWKSDGVLVYNDQDNLYWDIYSAENDSGYEIYGVDGHAELFCDEEEYDKIKDYYINEEDLDISLADNGSLGSNSLDYDIIVGLYDDYFTRQSDYSCSEGDILREYSFIIKSEDGLLDGSVSIAYTNDGDMILREYDSELPYNHVLGYTLDEETCDYLNSIIEEHEGMPTD